MNRRMHNSCEGKRGTRVTREGDIKNTRDLSDGSSRDHNTRTHRPKSKNNGDAEPETQAKLDKTQTKCSKTQKKMFNANNENNFETNVEGEGLTDHGMKCAKRKITFNTKYGEKRQSLLTSTSTHNREKKLKNEKSINTKTHIIVGKSGENTNEYFQMGEMFLRGTNQNENTMTNIMENRFHDVKGKKERCIPFTHKTEEEKKKNLYMGNFFPKGNEKIVQIRDGRQNQIPSRGGSKLGEGYQTKNSGGVNLHGSKMSDQSSSAPNRLNMTGKRGTSKTGKKRPLYGTIIEEKHERGCCNSNSHQGIQRKDAPILRSAHPMPFIYGHNAHAQVKITATCHTETCQTETCQTETGQTETGQTETGQTETSQAAVFQSGICQSGNYLPVKETPLWHLKEKTHGNEVSAYDNKTNNAHLEGKRTNKERITRDSAPYAPAQAIATIPLLVGDHNDSRNDGHYDNIIPVVAPPADVACAPLSVMANVPIIGGIPLGSKRVMPMNNQSASPPFLARGKYAHNTGPPFLSRGKYTQIAGPPPLSRRKYTHTSLNTSADGQRTASTSAAPILGEVKTNAGIKVNNVEIYKNNTSLRKNDFSNVYDRNDAFSFEGRNAHKVTTTKSYISVKKIDTSIYRHMSINVGNNDTKQGMVTVPRCTPNVHEYPYSQLIEKKNEDSENTCVVPNAQNRSNNLFETYSQNFYEDGQVASSNCYNEHDDNTYGDNYVENLHVGSDNRKINLRSTGNDSIRRYSSQFPHVNKSRVNPKVELSTGKQSKEMVFAIGTAEVSNEGAQGSAHGRGSERGGERGEFMRSQGRNCDQRRDPKCDQSRDQSCDRSRDRSLNRRGSYLCEEGPQEKVKKGLTFEEMRRKSFEASHLRQISNGDFARSSVNAKQILTNPVQKKQDKSRRNEKSNERGSGEETAQQSGGKQYFVEKKKLSDLAERGKYDTPICDSNAKRKGRNAEAQVNTKNDGHHSSRRSSSDRDNNLGEISFSHTRNRGLRRINVNKEMKKASNGNTTDGHAEKTEIVHTRLLKEFLGNKKGTLHSDSGSFNKGSYMERSYIRSRYEEEECLPRNGMNHDSQGFPISHKRFESNLTNKGNKQERGKIDRGEIYNNGSWAQSIPDISSIGIDSSGDICDRVIQKGTLMKRSDDSTLPDITSNRLSLPRSGFLNREGNTIRDRSRERSYDKSRERSYDKSRERSYDKSRERSHDKSRERSHDKSRERNHDKSRERSHDKSHESTFNTMGSKCNKRSRFVGSGSTFKNRPVASNILANEKIQREERSRSSSNFTDGRSKPSNLTLGLKYGYKLVRSGIPREMPISRGNVNKGSYRGERRSVSENIPYMKEDGMIKKGETEFMRRGIYPLTKNVNRLYCTRVEHDDSRKLPAFQQIEEKKKVVYNSDNSVESRGYLHGGKLSCQASEDKVPRRNVPMIDAENGIHNFFPMTEEGIGEVREKESITTREKRNGKDKHLHTRWGKKKGLSNDVTYLRNQHAQSRKKECVDSLVFNTSKEESKSLEEGGNNCIEFSNNTMEKDEYEEIIKREENRKSRMGIINTRMDTKQSTETRNYFLNVGRDCVSNDKGEYEPEKLSQLNCNGYYGERNKQSDDAKKTINIFKQRNVMDEELALASEKMKKSSKLLPHASKKEIPISDHEKKKKKNLSPLYCKEVNFYKRKRYDLEKRKENYDDKGKTLLHQKLSLDVPNGSSTLIGSSNMEIFSAPTVKKGKKQEERKEEREEGGKDAGMDAGKDAGMDAGKDAGKDEGKDAERRQNSDRGNKSHSVHKPVRCNQFSDKGKKPSEDKKKKEILLQNSKHMDVDMDMEKNVSETPPMNEMVEMSHYKKRRISVEELPKGTMEKSINHPTDAMMEEKGDIPLKKDNIKQIPSSLNIHSWEDVNWENIIEPFFEKKNVKGSRATGIQDTSNSHLVSKSAGRIMPNKRQIENFISFIGKSPIKRSGKDRNKGNTKRRDQQGDIHPCDGKKLQSEDNKRHVIKDEVKRNVFSGDELYTRQENNNSKRLKKITLSHQPIRFAHGERNDGSYKSLENCGKNPLDGERNMGHSLNNDDMIEEREENDTLQESYDNFGFFINSLVPSSSRGKATDGMEKTSQKEHLSSLTHEQKEVENETLSLAPKERVIKGLTSQMRDYERGYSQRDGKKMGDKQKYEDQCTINMHKGDIHQSGEEFSKKINRRKISQNGEDDLYGRNDTNIHGMKQTSKDVNLEDVLNFRKEYMSDCFTLKEENVDENLAKEINSGSGYVKDDRTNKLDEEPINHGKWSDVEPINHGKWSDDEPINHGKWSDDEPINHGKWSDDEPINHGKWSDDKNKNKEDSHNSTEQNLMHIKTFIQNICNINNKENAKFYDTFISKQKNSGHKENTPEGSSSSSASSASSASSFEGEDNKGSGVSNMSGHIEINTLSCVKRDMHNRILRDMSDGGYSPKWGGSTKSEWPTNLAEDREEEEAAESAEAEEAESKEGGKKGIIEIFNDTQNGEIRGGYSSNRNILPEKSKVSNFLRSIMDKDESYPILFDADILPKENLMNRSNNSQEEYYRPLLPNINSRKINHNIPYCIRNSPYSTLGRHNNRGGININPQMIGIESQDINMSHENNPGCKNVSDCDILKIFFRSFFSDGHSKNKGREGEDHTGIRGDMPQQGEDPSAEDLSEKDTPAEKLSGVENIRANQSLEVESEGSSFHLCNPETLGKFPSNGSERERHLLRKEKYDPVADISEGNRTVDENPDTDIIQLAHERNSKHMVEASRGESEAVIRVSHRKSKPIRNNAKDDIYNLYGKHNSERKEENRERITPKDDKKKPLCINSFNLRNKNEANKIETTTNSMNDIDKLENVVAVRENPFAISNDQERAQFVLFPSTEFPSHDVQVEDVKSTHTNNPHLCNLSQKLLPLNEVGKNENEKKEMMEEKIPFKNGTEKKILMRDFHERGGDDMNTINCVNNREDKEVRDEKMEDTELRSKKEDVNKLTKPEERFIERSELDAYVSNTHITVKRKQSEENNMQEESSYDNGKEVQSCDVVSLTSNICNIDRKDRVEAEKLNRDIPYITNIYKEMHRSPVMPLRIEAFHSLEDQRLIYGRPEWQKFLCPLCDKKYYPPNNYVKNYAHYIKEHWQNRKTLGGYIIFPCKLVHSKSQGHTLEKQLLEEKTEEEGKGRDYARVSRKMKKKKKLLIDPHYHCPLCLGIYFNDYNLLTEHCMTLHKSSGADPMRTLPSSVMHTPFTNSNDYYCTIKKLESERNIHMHIDAFQSGDPQTGEVTKWTGDISHDESSKTPDSVKLLHPAVNKKKGKHGRISKVIFCDEIQVREYDIELSQIEKFGASIGPVFTDDKEDGDNKGDSSEAKEGGSKKIDTTTGEEYIKEKGNNVSEIESAHKAHSGDMNDQIHAKQNEEIRFSASNTEEPFPNENDSTHRNYLGSPGERGSDNTRLEVEEESGNNMGSEQVWGNVRFFDEETLLHSEIPRGEKPELRPSDREEAIGEDNRMEHTGATETKWSAARGEKVQYDCRAEINANEGGNQKGMNIVCGVSIDRKSELLSPHFSEENVPEERDKEKPFSCLLYEEGLQIKEQPLNDILLENRIENSKEHAFSSLNKKIGKRMKHLVGDIHKRIISKYKRKIKMCAMKEQTKEQKKEASSFFDIGDYENVYMPPKNVSINPMSETENRILKKVIRQKKKEQIAPLKPNCRQSARIKSKMTQ
ncbi:conserved Plasmodium protein, unknown function [Plasmodium ovale]|uniref:Uncharacterized protein n=1 Tax=Plasmodium ovale TaxID=36330 RepID=A0A1C3KH23_PLAOA|nr:conserved Plasmodium protein, unknown function [Plasmodium ovale]